MTSFLDFISKVLTIVFANLFTLFALILILFLGATFSRQSTVAPRLPKTFVLYHDFSKSVFDNDSDDSFFDLNFSKVSSHKLMIDCLYRAAKDDSVQGFVGRLDACSLGLAQIEELRKAILHFRESGKFTKVYATSFGEGTNGTPAYYLATAFDELWVQPTGLVSPTGFLNEELFYKGLLDKIGVKAEFIKRKGYKSFPNRFTEEGYTKEQFENTTSILKNIHEPIVKAISDSRKLDPSVVTQLFDTAPFLALQALNEKLIDRVDYWDRFKDSIDKTTEKAKWVRLKKYAKDDDQAKDKIALIEINGAITSGESTNSPFSEASIAGSLTISKGIEQAIEDKNVKAIILRIDSPGGSMVGSDTIWREVKRAREHGKPVVASLSNTAASGGYYIAMAADKILALETTITGSIGTFMGKFDLSGLLQNLNIKWGNIGVGKNADIWSFTKGFSDEQRKKMDSLSDAAYAEFVTKAAEGRHMTYDELEQHAQGRVWTGAEALKIKLIDGFGGYREAIETAKELASISQETPVEVNVYPRAKNLKDYFTDFLDELQLTVKRADYIFNYVGTSFATLLSSLQLNVMR